MKRLTLLALVLVAGVTFAGEGRFGSIPANGMVVTNEDDAKAMAAVSNETLRAQGAEQTLSLGTSQEITRAEGAEGALGMAIVATSNGVIAAIEGMGLFPTVIDVNAQTGHVVITASGIGAYSAANTNNYQTGAAVSGLVAKCVPTNDARYLLTLTNFPGLYYVKTNGHGGVWFYSY